MKYYWLLTTFFLLSFFFPVQDVDACDNSTFTVTNLIDNMDGTNIYKLTIRSWIGNPFSFTKRGFSVIFSKDYPIPKQRAKPYPYLYNQEDGQALADCLKFAVIFWDTAEPFQNDKRTDVLSCEIITMRDNCFPYLTNVEIYGQKRDFIPNLVLTS